MAYLIAHIISVTLFSLCYKSAKSKRDFYTPAVHLNMYLFALAAAAVLVFHVLGFMSQPRLIFLGVCGGVCLCVAMRAFFFAMAQGGLAVGWTFVGLSVVIPLLASIFLWDEMPGQFQVIGLVLMIPCIVLFGDLHLQVEGSRKRWLVLVTIASLTTGVAQTLGKAISVYSFDDRAQLIFNYLFWVYVSGVLILFLLGEGKHWKLRAPETGLGIVMGCLNIVGMCTFVMALEHMEGIVFFPMKTVFNIGLTALLAVFIWKEEVTARQIVGIITGAVASMLVNIS